MQTSADSRTVDILIDALDHVQGYPDTRYLIIRNISELGELVLEQVRIRYQDRTVVTPDFTPETVTVSWNRTSTLLGVELTQDDAVHHLVRMRHGIGEVNDDIISVNVAPYRNDILHERDLMEDIGIAYGYHNISGSLVRGMTVGKELPIEKQSRTARTALTARAAAQTP